MLRTSEAKRAVRGNGIAIPPAICAIMRHPPMTVPKGRLQNCRNVCQVSASCHISALTPNSNADAPKRIRPYNGVFTLRRMKAAFVRPKHQDGLRNLVESYN